MPGLNEKTVIPLGVAVSLALGLISFIRSFDSKAADQSSEIAVLRVEVASLKAAQEKTDDRYERILGKLANIESRLGVVEVLPKK